MVTLPPIGLIPLATAGPLAVNGIAAGPICEAGSGPDAYGLLPNPSEVLTRIEGGGSPAPLRTDTSPLHVAPGIEIPYLFGPEPLVAKAAARPSDWDSLARAVEQKFTGKKLPEKIGGVLHHQDGWESVYETSKKWTANFVFPYIPCGTGIAERKLMIQEVLRHYRIPHLPLRRDARALALAREGITLQASLPRKAKPLEELAMDGARSRVLVQAHRKKRTHSPMPDEISEETRNLLSKKLGHYPTSAEMLTELRSEIESSLGSAVRAELDDLLRRVDEIENNPVLREAARARRWLVMPGEPSLIHYNGGSEEHTYNIFYDPRARRGQQWFLASW